MNRSADRPSRRTMLKLMGGAAVGAALEPLSAFADDASLATYRCKAMGCFMGAAIADAMGGPVECQHYKRIARGLKNGTVALSRI